jgi:hypothetical protein
VNLHGLTTGAINAVNPFLTGTVQVSTGQTTNADGSQTPTYETFTDVSMQVQALQYQDLKQIEGLNLNGTRRAIYMNGRADGVVRSLMKGGDLITIAAGPNAGVWLVALMAEQWPDWAKAIVTLQNETP